MEIETIINNLQFSNVFWQITATLLFMLGDIISGFVGAIILNNVDSQKMREGIYRKLLLILLVLLSFVFEGAFNIHYISRVVCIYIIVMEVVSILENLKKAGVDLGKLGDLLKIKTDDENTINLVVKNENNENEESEKK